ncbi:hypothetical protein Q1695_003463 [Nippostrongylus brasiliensis]|nr:hypothetical protein Q1695_003463 [Nippostrongylus brasiliensis]
MAILDVTDAIVPANEVVASVQSVRWFGIHVAVVSSIFNIEPHEVLNEYYRDKVARLWIVRHTFGYNSLTKEFLTKFDSKFIKNGYEVLMVCYSHSREGSS